MTTTSTTLFAVASNGIYALAGLTGVDIHTFSTTKRLEAWVAEAPESRRAITMAEAEAIRPEVRHYDLHEETSNDASLVGWVIDGTVEYGGSFGFVLDSEPTPCLAFGW